MELQACPITFVANTTWPFRQYNFPIFSSLVFPKQLQLVGSWRCWYGSLGSFGDPLAQPAMPKRRHARYLVTSTIKNTLLKQPEQRTSVFLCGGVQVFEERLFQIGGEISANPNSGKGRAFENFSSNLTYKSSHTFFSATVLARFVLFFSSSHTESHEITYIL